MCESLKSWKQILDCTPVIRKMIFTQWIGVLVYPFCGKKEHRTRWKMKRIENILTPSNNHQGFRGQVLNGLDIWWSNTKIETPVGLKKQKPEVERDLEAALEKSLKKQNREKTLNRSREQKILYLPGVWKGVRVSVPGKVCGRSLFRINGGNYKLQHFKHTLTNTCTQTPLRSHPVLHCHCTSMLSMDRPSRLFLRCLRNYKCLGKIPFRNTDMFNRQYGH